MVDWNYHFVPMYGMDLQFGFLLFSKLYLLSLPTSIISILNQYFRSVIAIYFPNCQMLTLYPLVSVHFGSHSLQPLRFLHLISPLAVSFHRTWRLDRCIKTIQPLIYSPDLQNSVLSAWESHASHFSRFPLRKTTLVHCARNCIFSKAIHLQYCPHKPMVLSKF